MHTSNGPTMNDIYKISYNGKGTTMTYIDPDTGEEMLIDNDDIFVGGASKKKSKASAKKKKTGTSTLGVDAVKASLSSGAKVSSNADVATGAANNTDANERTYIMLRSMLTLLKSIEKSEQNEDDILAVLKKIYSKISKNSSSSSSSSSKTTKKTTTTTKKKKGKGSELYSGKATDMADIDLSSSSTSSLASQLSTMSNAHNSEDYDEMNTLIEELTKITQD
jgi:hypothetical protein